MADKRAYAKLDVGYLTNPKIAHLAAISPTAVLLHVGSICYAAQHLTDGRVPVALLLRLTGATVEDAATLREFGLWECDGDERHAQVHDYLEHQRSAAEAKSASEAARAAANARHSKAHADRNADRTAQGNADPVPREKEREISSSGARKRGTRIPDDFAPDEISREWASREYPWVNIPAATEKFIDYWSALSGQRAVKLDWIKTWKNWIRSEAERTPRRANADHLDVIWGAS